MAVDIDLALNLGQFNVEVLRNTVGLGGCQISLKKKHYEEVRFNVISVTRGRVGIAFPEKSGTYCYEEVRFNVIRSALREGEWVSNFQKKALRTGYT